MKPTTPHSRRARRLIVTTASVVAISISAGCTTVEEQSATSLEPTPTAGTEPHTLPTASSSTAPSTIPPAPTTPPEIVPPATLPAELEQSMGQILDTHRAAGEFVGAVLAIRDSNGGELVVTSGSQQPGESTKRVDPAIPWGIGSVTKTFVAVVVLQLVEEGLLDLDGGIDAFLPDLADADLITPRQLLQHTSGLGEYINLPDLQSDAGRFWSAAELIALAEGSGRTGAPGASYHYSNTGYIVLGEIIEHITGTPWNVAVADRITEPLGLDDTKLIRRPGAPGYRIDDAEILDYTDRWDPSVGGSAGGLQSTSSDLLDYVEALATGALLDESSWSEMGTFIPGEDYSAFSVDHSYGLGLEQYVTADITVLGHLGSGASHSAFIGFDAESGTSVVVMLNVENAGPQAVMAIEALTAAAQLRP